MPRHVVRTPILVVDDNDGMRLLLGVVGSACGYDVVTAASAEDAIRVLRGNPRFGAMITDFSMPGLSGLGLVRWSKRHLPSCPVVLMSVHLPDGVEAEARAAGATVVVDKRVLIEHFASVLEPALRPLAA